MRFAGANGKLLDLGNNKKNLMHRELREGDGVEVEFELYIYDNSKILGVSLIMQPVIYILHRNKNPSARGGVMYGSDSVFANINSIADIQQQQTNFGNITITEVSTPTHPPQAITYPGPPGNAFGYQPNYGDGNAHFVPNSPRLFQQQPLTVYGQTTNHPGGYNVQQ